MREVLVLQPLKEQMSAHRRRMAKRSRVPRLTHDVLLLLIAAFKVVKDTVAVLFVALALFHAASKMVHELHDELRRVVPASIEFDAGEEVDDGRGSVVPRALGERLEPKPTLLPASM